MTVLTANGTAVGPLDRLRVPGKFTIFTFYTNSCTRCRQVEVVLREIMERRRDIAVRRLNVVDLKSPIAREQGLKSKPLPYVVVIAPDGKRTDFVNAGPWKVAAALRRQ